MVLDLGRAPRAYFTRDATTRAETMSQEVVDSGLLEEISRRLSFGPDNRAGLDGSLHRVSAMRNLHGEVYGITIRIGRSVSGNVERIRDLLLGVHASSLLILGPPGSGKTTVVRECCKMLAEAGGQNTMIVDTSNEIAGDGDVPHSSVGLARRMMVKDIGQQARVMIEALQNHTPDWICVDEIGRAQEVEAARTVKQRGVKLLASAHGDLRSLLKNAPLRGLVGGVETLTLGDDAAKKNQGSKLKAQRAGEPIFDAILELRVGEFDNWRLITDVAGAVDQVLLGTTFKIQQRVRDGDGSTRLLFGEG